MDKKEKRRRLARSKRKGKAGKGLEGKKCSGCGKLAKVMEHIYVLKSYKRKIIGGVKREGVRHFSTPLCEKCSKERSLALGQNVIVEMDKDKKDEAPSPFRLTPFSQASEELRERLGEKGVYVGVRLAPSKSEVRRKLAGEEYPCIFCQKPTDALKVFVWAHKNGITVNELPLCEKCEKEGTVGKFEPQVMFTEETMKAE